MKLYHVTYREIAALILEGGFEDRSPLDGGRATDGPRWGVWFSDAPVPFEMETPDGDWRPMLGMVTIADVPDAVASEYEVRKRYPGEEDAPWREFLIPAQLANGFPRTLEELEARPIA